MSRICSSSLADTGNELSVKTAGVRRFSAPIDVRWFRQDDVHLTDRTKSFSVDLPGM